jgi:hypothetical protein
MMLSWLELASSILWLRWRVVGWKGIAVVALLAVFIASNFPSSLKAQLYASYIC